MPFPCFKRLTCILSLLSFVTESLRNQTVRSLAALWEPDPMVPAPPAAAPPRAGSHLLVAARLGLQVYSEPKKYLLVASSYQLHAARHAASPGGRLSADR